MSVKFFPEIPQGTPEWHELRNGKVSATDAYDLLHGKPIEEILFAKQNNSFRGNYYTRRGHILEDEAKSIYSEIYEPLENFGFIENDKYPNAGFSPDGVTVSRTGLVECKAFNEKRHLAVFKNLDAHILAQIQFQLFISEFDWCDLVLYNPELSPEDAFLVRRVFPDQELFKKFQKLLKSS